MKSLGLTLALLDESGASLGIDTTRDRLTISSRARSEGDGFLSITLPEFAKAMERCLELGYLDSSLFSAFRIRGGLPVFLQGFLRRVFTLTDGVWLVNRISTSTAPAVKAVRQVCHLHGKTFQVCSSRRVGKALRQYVETDDSLSYVLDREVYLLFQSLFSSAINKAEQDLLSGEIYFRHGPGAVAEKYSMNQKWVMPYWTTSLQEVIPWWHAIRTSGEIASAFGGGSDCEPELLHDKPVSRLVAVPKTAKGPRLIAIEPVAHQFVQQALFEVLERHLSDLPYWDSINWRDQGRNQRLARAGSMTGSLATLDLSEASDRVHWGLVQDLLDRNRFFRKHVSACRTEVIDVGGNPHRLKKFASMGSALTFPIETMIFWTIALIGTFGTNQEALAYLRRGGKLVSAYGDDIIVPADRMPDVVSLLESHGFKVNTTKSFGNGSFRESCGADYFQGAPVNPVRARKWLDDPADVQWLEKTVNLRNRLYEAGYIGSSSYLDRYLRDIPFIPVGTPAIGLWTFDTEKIRTRWNPNLHRLEARCLRIVKKVPDDELDGYPALRKVLTPSLRKQPMDDGHLLAAGRPRTGRAKYGWTAIA